MLLINVAFAGISIFLKDILLFYPICKPRIETQWMSWVINENTSSSSVTSTRTNKNNWWKVDLGSTYYINLVVVYNRHESPQYINGARVSEIPYLQIDNQVLKMWRHIQDICWGLSHDTQQSNKNPWSLKNRKSRYTPELNTVERSTTNTDKEPTWSPVKENEADTWR